MKLNLNTTLLSRIMIMCLFTISIPLTAQIKYSDGNDSWNPNQLGNHRAVVAFSGSGNVAKTTIEWRRRDTNPELKKIIVQDASGKEIQNIKTENINRENGTIFFEPISGKGTYYVYYMPYVDEGTANYPKGIYQKPEDKADAKWLSNLKANLKDNAAVTEIQSVNAFNSFYPMEVIATASETSALVAKNSGNSFLVFPEDREHSIKLKSDLPQRWIQKGVQNSFSDTAMKGEYLAFQLGVYALEDLKNVKVTFSNLVSPSGTIDAKEINCINTDGTKYDGNPFTNTVSVSKGKIQAMWCGIDVPQTAVAGTYNGKATVTANGKSKEINLQITVSNQVTKNGGIDSPEKMTRLKWLNSTLAQENTVIAPYTPLTVNNSEIALLGRKLIVAPNGFPAQIQTFFTPEMTSVTAKANDILSSPIDFHFIDASGKEAQWKNNGVKFTKKEAGTVSWESTSTSKSVQMDVNASVEFDGFVHYIVKVTALEDVSFNDINFQMPMQPTSAKYMMGLGQKGGDRPATFDWKWDVAHKNQDGAWIGAVNSGLQFSLRDEKYSRPLNTNFYLQKPLLLPTSWGNENKGGITITPNQKSVVVNAYSGARTMKKGDVLYYNFNLLITPFHTINTDFQWDTKFYHKYSPIDSIAKTGATVINIHHANAINPYINYPFIEFKKMKTYIDEAHEKGLKVKIYNTVREVSNKAYETFALRSLGHEIYSPGKGGGFSWLQEHVGDDYIAAWFVPEIKDAAIVNSGMNRWHNYYVEGMNWLTQNVGIDGIYLDDVAFDRITMKRIKRVLTKDGHPGIIDLHSANQYNKSDGFNNSANLYMEHFPYINKLWFGEYFDYEKNQPDFFLTEVSGIPFGLMGEMLQDGGNPWRGMVYGMTNRLPWSDGADPRNIWKLWDSFGIKGSEMIGYWSENCPVKTNNDKVLATVYKKNGTALISIASWADADVNVKLNIDWKKLGINPAKATISAPEVTNFQPAKTFTAKDEITVPKGKGWLLIVK
ncbi:glycoside hydrolase domain-containing protein [Flavobacterium ginsenosidimutans]|uniref:glycoside hydrolase domain-containing protein n=1 Tax=Flavobacterium ginsenosidimutans TaxID=687844 RepID=UPI001EF3EDCF|nr:glycoside hydrolase domain-containing protein [Flavobacterium ginsenosidimutans]